jgi:hypothetical protein
MLGKNNIHLGWGMKTSEGQLTVYDHKKEHGLGGGTCRRVRNQFLHICCALLHFCRTTLYKEKLAVVVKMKFAKLKIGTK